MMSMAYSDVKRKCVGACAAGCCMGPARVFCEFRSNPDPRSTFSFCTQVVLSIGPCGNDPAVAVRGLFLLRRSFSGMGMAVHGCR